MRKMIFASIAVLAMAGAAHATDWGFGAGGFAGGVGGVGASISGAGNLSGTFKTGQSIAKAESMSFGQAESAFGMGVGSLPNGSPASGAFGNFVGASVASGSMSNASTAANGNGFSAAGTLGAGFGGTALIGGVGGVGGFVSGGN